MDLGTIDYAVTGIHRDRSKLLDNLEESIVLTDTDAALILQSHFRMWVAREKYNFLRLR